MQQSISKKTSLIILAITALVCSRVMFSLFNDAEGPNLLIVVGAAVILYILSLLAYLLKSSLSSSKRLFLGILIQIILALGLYVLFK